MTGGRVERDPLTETVIGLAIEVHRALGPGLLESAYEACFCYKLKANDVSYQRQVPLPVVYKSIKLDCGYRIDVVIDGLLVIELKTVDRLLPIHDAQMLTDLKLSDIRTGLLMNFNMPVLKDGIRRLVLG